MLPGKADRKQGYSFGFANLLRWFGPEQVAQIDLCPSVETTGAENASTRIHFGGSDRRAQGLHPPKKTVSAPSSAQSSGGAVAGGVAEFFTKAAMNTREVRQRS